MSGNSLSASSSNRPGIQAIIFDCDGVLVDTEYLKFLAWQDALSHHNVEFSIEEYTPLVGHSSKAIFQKIQTAKQLELPEAILELKNRKYTELQNQGVPAIAQMVDFAHYLSANKVNLGIQLGLASSAPKEEIFTNLKQIGLDTVFDLIISGSDDLDEYTDPEGKNKPKPYIYIEAAKRMKVSPELCIVFEDTQAGVEAAADAGMMAIAIPNRFTLNQNFSKANRIISHEDLNSFKTLNLAR